MGSLRLAIAAGLGVVLATAQPRTACAGPITFNTALPVHSDEVIVREQLIWLRATDDPSAMEREPDDATHPKSAGCHLWGLLSVPTPESFQLLS